MGRRTKAQIAHDEYCKDVDNYKWFVFNRASQRIESGWEYKQDALDACEDYDCDMEQYDCDVYSKRAMKAKGIKVDAILTKWKQIK